MPRSLVMNYKEKSDYKFNKDSTSMPWTESPFFFSIIKNLTLPEDLKKLACDYNSDGYVIIDLDLEESFLNNITKDTERILKSKDFVGQEKYEYTDHRRLFQAWKDSENIRELTKHPKILKTLKFLYNRDPFAFSTINFSNPTGQPLHSDTIHFNSYPKKWMTGVWVAFEDCNETNGTLRVVKGSHKWKEFDYNDLKITHPDLRENGEQKSYRDYDQFIRELVDAKQAKQKPINIKKGQAVVWTSNLLHGGIEVTCDRISRKSQAIHYFYHGCQKYYTPMFSHPMMGQYAEKWCSETKNIFTYKEKK